jgi:ribosome-binding factor A
VPENAHRIEDLLAAARAADAEVAERAAGASYAGDPDPYRRPDETEEEPEDVIARHVGAGDVPVAVAAPNPTGMHNHDADIGGEDPVDRFGEPIEAQAGAGDRA